MADPQKFGLVTGILASLVCIAGGLWILTLDGVWERADDGIWAGLGLYFVGKGLFVGPMLYLTGRAAAARVD
jgi:hypothetical protein